VVAVALVCLALGTAAFVASRWVQSSAATKFDEVGQPIGPDQDASAATPGVDAQTEPADVPPEASELNPMRISAKNIQPWPLSVESTLLACHQLPATDQVASGQMLASVTVTTDDGTTYAVNGTARGRMAQEGWSDVRDIWADGDLGQIIDLGLMIC
jgi:hypothetical protein